MNSRKIKIGMLALAATCSFSMFGKPAKQGVMTVPTADGSEIRVRLGGDEFFHQYFSEDGFPLVERNGIFYYGDIDAQGQLTDSGIKATNVADRSVAAVNFLAKIDKTTLEERVAKRASLSPGIQQMQLRRAVSAPQRSADGNDGPPYPKGYGLFSDTHFPAYGDQKAIVILVEYTDVKFKTSYTVDAFDYFNRMLNEDGFSDYGATGCAAEYFRLNSGDSFRPEFDVYGPVTLAHNQAYYGGNNFWGNDQRPGDMVKEACDALDDEVNFADYDRDGDGIVDNIFVFYAGMGEASGGSANTVWPHSWDMTSAGFPNLYYDGVKLHTYGCSNEWESGRPDGVGTFIHEFSHVMGLPDLYATSYTGAFTPGSWSALDYGPYNNDGMTPPLYGAFERYALGWVKPREVDRAVSATLQPISQNVCGLIKTSKNNEFFLLENRQKESWDTYIPGHGMLIWHVDYNASVWSSNTVNNSSSHQYVDIEEADGSQSESSRSGDAFPGTAHKTSFTAQTSPAMKMWNGTEIDYPITNIAENSGIITFDILGGGSSELPVPQVYDPTDVTATSFVLNWESVEGFDAILNVYTRPENNDSPVRPEDDRVYLPGFKERNMGQESSVLIDGLEPETSYYFTMAYSSGWETSVPSEERLAFTGQLTIEYYTVRALTPEDVTSNSFKACWQELAGASDYLVTLYQFAPGDPYLDVCDFSDGVDNIGDWSSTSRMAYGMETYCGEAIPSLRMSDGSILSSPVYSDYIRTLSFWHRGSNTAEGDMINVYAMTPEGQVLVEAVQVVKKVGGQTVEITDIPAFTTQVILEFKRYLSSGSVALDDVTVGHGSQSVPEVMENCVDMSSNGNPWLIVSGLHSLTDYGYTVRATDGELFSKPSSLIRVQTTAASAVSAESMAGVGITVSGRTITAANGEYIKIYDCAGAVVAQGKGAVTVPSEGLYIVTVPSAGQTRKAIVR